MLVELKPQSIESNVFQEAAQDLIESERRTRMLGMSALAVGLAAFNTTKIPLVTAPAIAIEALQYSDNSAAAGIATGAAFGLWTYMTSGAASGALNHLPATKTGLAERHPEKIKFMADNLPGYEVSNPNQERSASRAKRIGRSILTHLHRGAATVTIGANFYVATAHLDAKSEPEVTRLRRQLAIDGTVGMGLVAGISAGAVEWIGDSHPVFAEQIEAGATDIKVMLAAAGILMGGQWAKNKLQQRRTAPGLALEEQSEDALADDPTRELAQTV